MVFLAARALPRSSQSAKVALMRPFRIAHPNRTTHVILKEKDNELTAPFGAFSPDGRFRWSEVMWNEIKSLELTRFVAPDPEAAPNTSSATRDNRQPPQAAPARN